MRILDRNLGSIMVMELIGDMGLRDTTSIRERTEKYLSPAQSCRFGIFSLLDASDLNPGLMQEIILQARSFERSVILGHFDREEVNLRIAPPKNVTFRSSLAQGIQCFADELPHCDFEAKNEQKDFRKFDRLRLSLPVELTYSENEKEKFVYQLFTVNLSEGGMLARFLDLQSAWRFFHQVDRYDLPLMDVRILIPKGGEVALKAKVVFQDDLQALIHLEFYSYQEGKEHLKTLIQECRADRHEL